MKEEEKLCECGRPLHYTDPTTREVVEKFIQNYGEHIRVVVHFVGYRRTFLVSRHYIALHGFKGTDLARVGFKEVSEHDG